jgi:two-component system, OmpR family, sensor kinase
MARSSDLAAADRRLLRSSTDELERLSSSVESLLALSLTPLVLNLERANLVRLVREAVSSCTVDGRRDRVWVKAPSSISIVADKASLRAAIANVVRNGLLYSPDSTNVIVEVRKRNGVATVLVKDSGPGIAPAEREAIFRPFVRGRAGRRTAGTGVGLALAKQVIEAHHGTIAVRSNGSGSAFEIRVSEAL